MNGHLHFIKNCNKIIKLLMEFNRVIHVNLLSKIMVACYS